MQLFAGKTLCIHSILCFTLTGTAETCLTMVHPATSLAWWSIPEGTLAGYGYTAAFFQGVGLSPHTSFLK
jgi:hypothetical protein